MPLTVGSPAPRIRTTDFSGQPIDTAAMAGRRLLLSFYRYASCPLCNLRMRELTLAYPELQAQGVQLLAVFQSSPAAIGEYLERHAAPFPIIADPQRALYRAFGVESRWRGMLSLPMWGKIARAFAAGYLPGKVDGDFHGRPADFLIDEAGRIVQAHYGQRIDDHLPLATIRAWLAAAPQMLEA